MKAKNNFSRKAKANKHAGRIQGARKHAGTKASSGASGESGDAVVGRKKAFLLKRSTLSFRNPDQ
jgi:hypothetical protein